MFFRNVAISQRRVLTSVSRQLGPSRWVVQRWQSTNSDATYTRRRRVDEVTDDLSRPLVIKHGDVEIGEEEFLEVLKNLDKYVAPAKGAATTASKIYKDAHMGDVDATVTPASAWDVGNILSKGAKRDMTTPVPEQPLDIKAQARSILDLLASIAKESRPDMDSQQKPSFTDLSKSPLPTTIYAKNIRFIEAADRYLTTKDFLRSVPTGSRSFLRGMYSTCFVCICL
jgi:hypothetical protein